MPRRLTFEDAPAPVPDPGPWLPRTASEVHRAVNPPARRPEPRHGAPSGPQRPSVPAPVPLDNPRTPDGKVASAGDACAITEVRLPNGKIGYRVGPGGRIYDKKVHAETYAARRLDFYGRGH